jgi:hypothetical protein
VEESHYKPGGTVTSSLGHWASRVLRSGKDPTCGGRWSYICLGKKDKNFAIVTVYRVGHNHNTGDATAFQKQYRTQYADETARVEINPHKQTMIDLEYFTEELKTDGFEVAVFIDANKALDHQFRSQNHDHKYKSDKGFHIDGSIDGSIATYTRNCGLRNTLSERHAETGTAISNTHLRGTKQIDFVLTTAGIAPFIRAIALLDFDVVFRTDHRTFFIDIDMDGFFGSATETLPVQRLRQLQLENPRVATAYRKALHQQFIHHSVFRRIKDQSESRKSGEWNIAQESKYEALDRDIFRAMLHAESLCLLKHNHNTPWSPAIGRSTSSIIYWDLHIKHSGIRDKNDALLDYYYDLSGVGAEFDISLTVRECIHQINNARSKLKDAVNTAIELRTQFEVDLAMAVVEHKMPEFRSGEIFMECDKDVLVQKELKSRENRRTSKRSWKNLGRQIRVHLKPHTLQNSKLTAIEVSGSVDGSWSRIDTKEQVEALLIDCNVEQFSHAGKNPFGYTALGDELGHTGDTLMADAIYNGTLEHRYLTDHAIRAIVKQLRKHPLLTKIISPVVTT